jgi:mono/diheme cytochrome c family protein
VLDVAQGEHRMKLPPVIAIALALIVAACAVQPRQRTVSEMSGMEMYETFCASCHGIGGEGDGPVAPLVKIGVPDLTRIARRDGGEFPTEDVRRTIDGRFDRPAHGPRDMPVWGWQFYNSETMNDPDERARVDALIGKLIDYLRSIQK